MLQIYAVSITIRIVVCFICYSYFSICNSNDSRKELVMEILDGGPWYFGGRPILLKPWSLGMVLSKEGYKRIPIWVRFFNIPLELWTREGLSRIASTVGSPLHADQMTASLKRLAYARICLEINIDDTLPTSLDLLLENGSSVEVRIEYGWIPKRCSICMGSDHPSKNCLKSARQIWVPKSAGNPGNVNSNKSGLTIQPEGSGPVSPWREVTVPSAGHGPCIPQPPTRVSTSGTCELSNTYAPLHNSPPDDDDALPAERMDDEDSLKANCDVVGQAIDEVESGSTGEDPSSPSSFSSTPELAKRINMVDELEKKMGRRSRQKKNKKRRGGKAVGASPSIL